MGDFSTQVIGGRLLVQRHRQLPRGLVRRIARQALRTAAQRVLVPAMKREAYTSVRRRSGGLGRAVGRKAKHRGRRYNPNSYIAREIIGVRFLRADRGQKAAKSGRNAYYYRFLEDGTQRIRARRFMLRTLQSHGKRAEGVAYSEAVKLFGRTAF